MKKALVIGGSGFMGSHTADELSKRGYEVTVFDRFHSPWLKVGQKMIIGDYMDEESLSKALQEISILYHFAGIADIELARKNPLATIDANVLGLTKVLEAIKKINVERFIFASTMYVYSNFGSFYRASKQAAEIIIEAYSEHYGIDFTLLRYGSLYGPRAQNWNGIRRFASQIVEEGEVQYSGDGTEMREYIHVEDAARLSVDILDSAYINQAITITGQQLIKVDDLISVLFEIAGQPRKVKYQGKSSTPTHYGHTPYRYTPKAAKKLVPQQFVDLGQGLLGVIEDIHNEQEISGN
ncbi:NAD(P)-dependent oxidoreductase [Leptospira levettii]|uniref:NAD-dependent epimerase/dehydratase family protein n=1 Tax=Leptospira levettii TaxID=2023178 RepID=UPI00223D4856|nr:NAD(P)-dependent oxidoreductase [Leptospira levettii]MCW7497027.1 NAD(P)-dependent oxidoreductase [Leptospira levettii]